MKCAYICKASSTRKWWLQLLFYDYYFDFATPPLLPLCISTHPLFHHSPPHTPHKVLFKIDLQESTSFSLPLLAQLQTAAMSLFFKVTLIIGNVKKKKIISGWTQAVFLKWSTGQKQKEHATRCVLCGKGRNFKEVHVLRSLGVFPIKGLGHGKHTRS